MLLAWLKKILVVLLLLINLSAIGQLWMASMNIPDRGAATLDRWEAQMILVKKTLPIQRGVVGYVSEEDVPGADYAFWDTETEFLLTQYALAPLILKKGSIAEWNVVVLNDKNLATWESLLQETYPHPYEIINIKSNIRIFHKLGYP
jgi:hypothetical protein